MSVSHKKVVGIAVDANSKPLGHNKTEILTYMLQCASAAGYQQTNSVFRDSLVTTLFTAGFYTEMIYKCTTQEASLHMEVTLQKFTWFFQKTRNGCVFLNQRTFDAG